MAIDKNEIDKYIFDPENPKQCKSYELLLQIAKKEKLSIISPDFMRYFFSKQIVNKDFEKSLWDKPKNFHDLDIFEKLKVFKNNFSKQELNEFISSLDLNTTHLTQFRLFKSLTFLESENFADNFNEQALLLGVNVSSNTKDFDDLIKQVLLETDYDYSRQDVNPFYAYHEHMIIFSREFLEVLNFNINRSSIIITLEENSEEFWKYKKSNIKPIFLKKIEDVDILLNVLEQDLKKEKQSKSLQEEISTLDEVKINNFFSLKELKLNNLQDKKEIYIVGENGDGKTLLLQSIVVALAGVKEGDVFDLVKSQPDYQLVVKDSEGKQYTPISEEPYSNIIAYGAARNNYCQMKEDSSGYLTLFKGEYDLKNPVKWLQYLDYSEQSDKENIISVVEAKTLLRELLNRDIEIKITPDEVIFTEKGSQVSFDQLSAGYKGVISIICDLIARLFEKQRVDNLHEFQGIVLIDEVELHLHPRWQYGFMKKLRATFPLIQFIVTTHSPSVLLGAGMEAVYYQVYKEEGSVKVSEQKEVKNDFLNDIQNDVFGFDINDERIHNPSSDDKVRQQKAKEALLGLIDTIEKEQ